MAVVDRFSAAAHDHTRVRGGELAVMVKFVLLAGQGLCYTVEAKHSTVESIIKT